jgi:hypothetical protein
MADVATTVSVVVWVATSFVAVVGSTPASVARTT